MIKNEDLIRKVPFFDYPKAYTDDRDDLIRIIEDVGNRGAFIMQKDLEDFEKSQPLSILAYQYDLVCNGFEISSGNNILLMH